PSTDHVGSVLRVLDARPTRFLHDLFTEAPRASTAGTLHADPMLNAAKGAVLAAVNAVAIAFAITLEISPHAVWSRHLRDVMVSITILAMLSSIPLGAALGVLAGKLRDNRLLVLELVTLALVPMVGLLTMQAMGAQPKGGDLFGLVAVSWSPTVISVIVL